MKNWCVVLLAGFVHLNSQAQELKTYTFPVGSIREVQLETVYPELIEISSYQGNEVKIEASVYINNGTHNEAFKLDSRQSDGTLYLSTNIENLKELPRKYLAFIDGNQYVSETEKGLNELIQQKGNHYTWRSEQVLIEVKLKVWIPKKLSVVANAQHGGIEIRNFEGTIKANSKHKYVDMAISETDKATVELATRFGELYSNLDLSFVSAYQTAEGSDRWNITKGTLNGGSNQNQIYLESKHGNVYLRKTL